LWFFHGFPVSLQNGFLKDPDRFGPYKNKLTDRDPGLSVYPLPLSAKKHYDFCARVMAMVPERTISWMPMGRRISITAWSLLALPVTSTT
jgi:hypothetical protein